MTVRPPLLPHFSTLAPAYDLLLCDIWGVVHDGVTAHARACDALARARAAGATVVLVTNAPRPSAAVARQIEGFGVPRTAYDAIVSSGDVTRGEIEKRPGQSVYHLGPARDRPLFEGFALRTAPPESADYCVCTGLFDDETETPEDYRAQLSALAARRLFMLCANPDVVVERGHKLVYCAGALADLYAALGGEVLYAGKPYRPIYDAALARAATVAKRQVERRRVLAIGDSVRTDFTGAQAAGFDFLFVTSALHAEEAGGRDTPDIEALAAVFAAAGGQPRAVMRRLAW